MSDRPLPEPAPSSFTLLPIAEPPREQILNAIGRAGEKLEMLQRMFRVRFGYDVHAAPGAENGADVA